MYPQPPYKIKLTHCKYNIYAFLCFGVHLQVNVKNYTSQLYKEET
jgi:hypothetical protein